VLELVTLAIRAARGVAVDDRLGGIPAKIVRVVSSSVPNRSRPVALTTITPCTRSSKLIGATMIDSGSSARKPRQPGICRSVAGDHGFVVGRRPSVRPSPTRTRAAHGPDRSTREGSAEGDGLAHRRLMVDAVNADRVVIDEARSSVDDHRRDPVEVAVRSAGGRAPGLLETSGKSTD